MGQIFWPKLFCQKEPLCLCNTITANTNIVCKALNKSLDLNCFIKEHIEILFILKISLAFSQIHEYNYNTANSYITMFIKNSFINMYLR